MSTQSQQEFNKEQKEILIKLGISSIYNFSKPDDLRIEKFGSRVRVVKKSIKNSRLGKNDENNDKFLWVY